MRIVRELWASFVHVDADDVAILMKVLPEQLDGTAFFDTNLLITNKLNKMHRLVQIWLCKKPP